MMTDLHKDVTVEGGADMSMLQQEAARIVKDKISQKGVTLKPSDYRYENHSELFALAYGSVRCHSILKEILERSGSSLLKEKVINKDAELAVVLLYQHFVGTEFECAPCFSKIMKKHTIEIKATYEAVMMENNAKSLTDFLKKKSRQIKGPPALPCCARVNLIKCTVKEAIDRLCENSLEYVGRLHIYRFQEDVSFLSECQFGLDPLMEDVLIFPCDTDLDKDGLVTEGILVLQERASCVPAHVLNPPPGSVVLDCCAAPGNQTGHLASLMRNQGRVIAMDRRFQGLSKMKPFLRKTGSSCVETIAQNFLTMSRDSREVSDITMILLDPPCNENDISSLHGDDYSIKEISVFKRHQISLLGHALQFPNVQRVVYTTSSIHEEEGEELVQTAMFHFKHAFRFLPILPEWPYSRGSESFLNYKSFLRLSPEEHLTQRRFIACFERIKKPEISVRRNRIKSEFDCDCMDETMAELYQEAAKILKCDLEDGAASSLVHSSNYKNLRQLFDLVSESIRHQSALKDIIKRCGSQLLNEKLINNDVELAVVLLYQHLVRGDFACAPRYKKIMRKHGSEIKAAHDSFLKENKAASLTDLLSQKSNDSKDLSALPHYARVNLTKCCVQEAVGRLNEDGWECVGKMQVDRFKENVMSLSERQFGLDPLLEDVLVFPFSTDMDTFMEDGILTQQERASCVPAHVLNPQPGSVVLDCCAFPGNKSSHLASLMGNQGRVIAMDHDAERVSTMDSLFQKSGANCVETAVQDFLTLSPDSEDMADVTMILLDPSNSFRDNHAQENGSWQSSIYTKWHYVALLKHALKFPNVQRVVYSTCSTSHLENEEVVEEVMCNVRTRFHFLSVMPNWPSSRGSGWYLNHQRFLRVSAESESQLTGGCFVACFERIRHCGYKNIERISSKDAFISEEKKMEKCQKGNENQESEFVVERQIENDIDDGFENVRCDSHIENNSVVERKRKKLNERGEKGRMGKK